MKRLNQFREDFGNALKKLEEAVTDAESDLEIDGTIQRFEFTFELMWKFLKVFLESEGIICRSPKECLKEAYKGEIIENQNLWLNMLSDRNLSVHIYDMETSREIFDRIKTLYLSEFQKIKKKI
jgi:nucleotidyltransferase substrate binding protein (TIGR01987 family)